MHTITLKTDDHFFEMLNEMAKRYNTSRSSLIRSAVVSYKERLDQEQLRQQIKNASFKVRDEALHVSHEFEQTTNDGLEHV